MSAGSDEAQKSSILKLVLVCECCSASIPPLSAGVEPCSASFSVAFSQYYSRHLTTLETSSQECWRAEHWQTKGARLCSVLHSQLEFSLSGKRGLRVNFLAVICRKGASTICCRPEHEKHYLNPRLPDINRMNGCFFLYLIWMNLSKWQSKQVKIHLSSSLDEKRQSIQAAFSFSCV